VHCIETHSKRLLLRLSVAAALAALVAGCGSPPAPAPTPGRAPSAAPAPAPRSGAANLSAPTANRSWDDFKLQAARRLVAAHPNASYTSKPPEPLLAVPVIETELNADGSVRSIRVMREPTQAKDTSQLAIDAIRRAAPYGDMSRVPKPWKYVEVFLFDDERRFKPRTLDN
jgi:hypothetical protein